MIDMIITTNDTRLAPAPDMVGAAVVAAAEVLGAGVAGEEALAQVEQQRLSTDWPCDW